MKYSLLRYFLNLLLAVVMILGVTKLTTFGWWFGPTRVGRGSNTVIDLGLEARLRNTVEHLAGVIGVRNTTESLDRSVEFISRELRSMGYDIQERRYSINGKTYKNLVAIVSVGKDAETILVGAHYDSCFNPGADDNSSGVAGVLELARSLQGATVKKNIMFVFFTNEEPPFFRTQGMGSRVFAEELRSVGIPVKVAIILEMIGYYSNKPFSQRYLPMLGPFFPNRGDFISFVSDLGSRHLLGEMGKVFRSSADVPLRTIAAPGTIQGINFSDHASFWLEGYRAIMVTDTAYLRNPYYHTDHDQPDKLDYHKMAGVVTGIRNVILNWAQ